SLEHMAEELKRDLKEGNVEIVVAERRDQNVVVKLKNRDDTDKAKNVLADRFPILRLNDTIIEDGQPVLVLQYIPQELQRLREFALEQSLETIRNRIDQFGVTEPIIARQGESDIVIQLPGIQDPQRAKELIGKTALLEFKLLAGDDNEAREYTDNKKPV